MVNFVLCMFYHKIIAPPKVILWIPFYKTNFKTPLLPISSFTSLLQVTLIFNPKFCTWPTLIFLFLSLVTSCSSLQNTQCQHLKHKTDHVTLLEIFQWLSVSHRVTPKVLHIGFKDLHDLIAPLTFCHTKVRVMEVVCPEER